MTRFMDLLQCVRCHTWFLPPPEPVSLKATYGIQEISLCPSCSKAVPEHTGKLPEPGLIINMVA